MSDSQPIEGVIDTSQFPVLDAFPAFKLKTAKEDVFRPPVTARYKPQPDITAHELALILPGLLGKPLYEEEWLALGSATRHFERVKLTS